MRLTSISRLLCAVSTATAATFGQVLIHDPAVGSIPSHETISPSTSLLIFAQRLGLSSFYSLSDADTEVTRQINGFGGPQQHLFGHQSDKEPSSRVLLLVDEVENAQELVTDKSGFATFDVEPAPHPNDNAQLLSEFAEQSGKLIQVQTVDMPVYRVLESMAKVPRNQIWSHYHRTIVHVTSLGDAAKEYGSSSSQYREQVALVRSTIRGLMNLAMGNPMSLTIVLMPPESHSAKRSADSYGFESLKRRSAKPQVNPGEAVLSSQGSTQDAKASNEALQGQSQSAYQPTVARIPFPSRYTSQAACERTTRNCTGHGVCKHLYNETVGSQPVEYFGCLCNKPEISANGSKTTWFGGSACQKKSVVAPFWLLAGVTVGMVSIVSIAVGMLLSMGSEELPSVIGAGVSGPRPK